MNKQQIQKMTWGTDLVRELEPEALDYLDHQPLTKMNLNYFKKIKDKYSDGSELSLKSEQDVYMSDDSDIKKGTEQHIIMNVFDQEKDFSDDYDNYDDKSRSSKQSDDKQRFPNKEQKFYKYKFDKEKGPSQFLKVLSKNDSQVIYKLSDLYYPYFESEYDELIEYAAKLNYIYKIVPRESRIEYVNNLWQQMMDKSIQNQQETEQKKEFVQQEQQQLINQQPFYIKKRSTNELKLLQSQMRNFNPKTSKISQSTYFEKLQNQIIQSINQEIFQQENDDEKPIEIEEEDTQNIIKQEEEHSHQFQKNGQSYSSELIKNDENQSNSNIISQVQINQDDDIFLNNIFKLQKKELWGDLRENQIEQQNFDQKGQLFKIQNVIQEKKTNNLKNLIFQKSIYYNEQLFDIQKLTKHDKNKKIIIDLNNSQIFYEKIYNHLSSKNQKKSSKQQNQNVKEIDIDGLDDDNLSIDSQSVSSKLLNQNQSHLAQKINKLKLKELRIQAVKQGLDPQSISLADETYLRKRLLEKENLKNEKNQQSMKTLWKMIENHQKMQKKTSISHSRIADKFIFNDFSNQNQNYKKFHRFDFGYQLRNEKMLNRPFKVQVIGEKSKSVRKNYNTLEDLNELVDSSEIFKNRKRLSCRNDEFSLFEFIEEYPLILQNIGMGSKFYRYVYPHRVQSQIKQQIESMEENEEMNKNELEIQTFKEYIKNQLGDQGAIQFLNSNEKLPLIGQTQQSGILILENNLFKAPVFKQKASENDFLLIRIKNDTQDVCKYFLRKIDYIYTVGQIEPKMEVYAPNSRTLSAFIKKSLKFAVKNRFALSNQVDMRDLAPLYKSINDHNLRKCIRELGGEQDHTDNKLFHYNKDLIDSDNEQALVLDEYDMIPEETCLYERMRAGISKLKDIGVTELRSEDKINLARIKLFKNFPQDARKKAITRFIVEVTIYNNLITINIIAQELQLTPWNLSQSFLAAQQTQGRLQLTGLGDPTNNNGGYSYIKMPLKISRHEKEERRQQNDEQNKTQVTGTDADLRKLNMSEVKNILKQNGFDEQLLQKLSRWEKIDLLRQVSNINSQSKDESQIEGQDLSKYERTLRITTKMQKEKYQKDINKIFQMLIEKLQIDNPNLIPADFSETDGNLLFQQIIDKEKQDIILNDKRQQEHQAYQQSLIDNPQLREIKVLPVTKKISIKTENMP